MLDLARGYATGRSRSASSCCRTTRSPGGRDRVDRARAELPPDPEAIDRALVAIARALRPGGLLAIDLCDLTYAEAVPGFPINARVADEWAIITERSTPSPDRFVRQMAVFTRNEDGSWRRDDERHVNVLIDTARVPPILAEHGVRATIGDSLGSSVELLSGLHTIIGHKDP
jgi:hypothetical protein